jgi:hypothetical protein
MHDEGCGRRISFLPLNVLNQPETPGPRKTIFIGSCHERKGLDDREIGTKVRMTTKH